MTTTLLVMGAGTGAGNSLIRSLQASDLELDVVGCQPDRFLLKKSLAERNYVVPQTSSADLARALQAVIDAESIDLLIPGSDTDAARVAALRQALTCRLFMPSSTTIELCQDKFLLAQRLRDGGVAVAETSPVTDRLSVERIFESFSPAGPLWCRMRTGSGSRGATPVMNAEQAWAWISYWNELRGVPVEAFTLSEYLPGRDFNVQGLWKDGALVLIKMIERLSYLGGTNTPSGVSSTPALAKTVREESVLESAVEAVRLADAQATGVFNVDFKANETGTACVTEINAGRFAMITNIYDLVGRHNMAATYVELAMDADPDIEDVVDVPEDYYLVRDLDTEPAIFHADQMFEGLTDAIA